MNCPFCGQQLLDPPPAFCTNCGKNISQWSRQAATSPKPYDYFTAGSYFETQEGLSKLKTGLLIFLIGSIVVLVPVVGTIGEIVVLVGILFFILAFRTLGRSSLEGATNYKTAGSWLVRGVILSIVAAIIGIIIAVLIYISQILSEIPPVGSLPSNPFTVPAFHSFFFGIVTVILVAYLIWFAAWGNMCLSMRKLSEETSQKGIATAANLYIVQIVLFLLSLPLLAILYSYIFAGIPHEAATNPLISLYGVFSYFLLGGYWILGGVDSIAQELILIVGSYVGYRAVQRAIGSYRVSPPPPSPATSQSSSPPTVLPPPPPPPQQMNQKQQQCPNCGYNIVGGEAAYCSNCGSSLRG